MMQCLKIYKWIAGLLVTLISITANAQYVLFTIPDTTPDYASYRYVDECREAIGRIAGEIERKDSVWYDTARLDRSRLMRSIPQEAIEAGKLCMTNLDVDTIHVSAAHSIAALLLLVGLDDDVERLYDRVHSSVSEERHPYEYVKMINVYSQARPVRMTEMRSLYERAKSLQWASSLPGIIIEMGTTVGNTAYESGDTAYAKKIADEVFRLNETLSIDDRNWGSSIGVEGNLQRTLRVWKLYRRITERELMDSLAISAKAFGGYREAALERVFGDPIAAHVFYGDQVSSISADFIFQAEQEKGGKYDHNFLPGFSKVSADTAGPWPIKQRVNLIVFLQGGCHPATHGGITAIGRNNGNHFGCTFTASMLRRLKEKFPELEVAVVTRTFGSLGNGAPLEPEQEADTLAKFFLGFNRIPGTLLIETTDFFRVSGLDQRRVDLPTKNETTLDGLTSHRKVLGLDQDGVIFYWKDRVHKEDELELEKEIEAVLARKPGQAY